MEGSGIILRILTGYFWSFLLILGLSRLISDLSKIISDSGGYSLQSRKFQNILMHSLGLLIAQSGVLAHSFAQSLADGKL